VAGQADGDPLAPGGRVRRVYEGGEGSGNEQPDLHSGGGHPGGGRAPVAPASTVAALASSARSLAG